MTEIEYICESFLSTVKSKVEGKSGKLFLTIKYKDNTSENIFEENLSSKMSELLDNTTLITKIKEIEINYQEGLTVTKLNSLEIK